MNTIDWLSPEENGEWDEFVGRHPLGLVYHLSAWTDVLETAFKHIHGGVVVLRDGNGQIKAGLPVYNIKSWLLKNRTVSLPFASVGDPLVSNIEEFSLLWQPIEDMAVRNRSKRIEIRTRLVAAESIPEFLTAGTKYKHHHLRLDESADALLRSFHQSCVTRRIKKAKREAVVVEERHDDDDLRTFYSIMEETRRRQMLPPMPYKFFHTMLHRMGPDHASLYLAIQNGQAIGGMLALKTKNIWTGEYSGQVENAHSGSDQLLYWHVIQLAKNSGAKSFSFGRTTLDNTGLLDYKRRWATIEEDATDYIYPLSRAKLRDDDPNHSVNPVFYSTARLIQHAPHWVQRMVGDFCYRHLG
ncbi:MAG: GNAT family N-acetyltransferase [Terracidiphilus sp.]|jgi:hypothetical protein